MSSEHIIRWRRRVEISRSRERFTTFSVKNVLPGLEVRKRKYRYDLSFPFLLSFPLSPSSPFLSFLLSSSLFLSISPLSSPAYFFPFPSPPLSSSSLSSRPLKSSQGVLGVAENSPSGSPGRPQAHFAVAYFFAYGNNGQNNFNDFHTVMAVSPADQRSGSIPYTGASL